MTISDELLEMIRCPQTRQPLGLADDATLESANREIDAGRLTNQLGKPIQERLAAALVCQDRTLMYPVIDDIPILLSDEAISLAQLDKPDESADG